jgi:hypothetical protein
MSGDVSISVIMKVAAIWRDREFGKINQVNSDTP